MFVDSFHVRRGLLSFDYIDRPYVNLAGCDLEFDEVFAFTHLETFDYQSAG